MKKYPVCEPVFLGNEKKYVLDCLDSNWISSGGTYLKQFEEGMARKVGRKFGFGVANGTAALMVALRALQLPRGSEVICPAFCMAAPVMAIINEGLVPVFVDVDKTWNMDPDRILQAVGDKTRAIMVVHNYGLVSDMDRIADIAGKNNLKIIEDAAETHGAFYKDRMAGAFGDISCFSFYANKILTTGEGGIVLADDPALADRVAFYRNLCFSSDPAKRFLHEDVGFNFRMTNVQAAIGLGQLEKFDSLVRMRIRMGENYLRHLKKVRGIALRRIPSRCLNVYWMFGILIDEDVYGPRDELMERLKEQGVETRRFFYSADEQPFLMKGGFVHNEDRFPMSRALSKRGLYLPSSPTLDESDFLHICSMLDSLARS